LGASTSFRRDESGNIVARRILSDPSQARYFGYEVILRPQTEAGSYVVSFRDLEPQATELLGGYWKFESPREYPRPRTMSVGEALSVDLGAVATDGDPDGRIIDDVELARLQPIAERSLIWKTDWFGAMRYASLVTSELRSRGLEPVRTGESARAGPAISGSAKVFAAADAEFRIVEPSLAVDGKLASGRGSLKATHGNLVFFTFPGAGAMSSLSSRIPSWALPAQAR
jgi:hypothetical protein